MTIRGTTALLAHIGFPTQGFTSPLIYNPYFEQAGIDAVLVPMGCRAEHFPRVLTAVFTLTNIRGALITMPHKMAAATLVDDASLAVRIAGSCNAVRRMAEVSSTLLERNGFTAADLALVVPHQANLRIIKATQDRLCVDDSKMMINIDRYGNTTAGTIPLGLTDAVEQGRLKKGDLVLLVAVGAGYTTGGILLRWAY